MFRFVGKACFVAAALGTGAVPAAAQTATQWSGPAPAAALRADGLRLLGHWSGDRFLVSEILTDLDPAPAARAPALPVAGDLGLQASVFGSDGRARLGGAGDRPTLICEPGNAAAGVVLTRPGFRLPEGAELRVEIDARIAGDFGLAVSDAARTAAENPLVLGRIARQRARFTLPAAGLDRATWRSFTVLCPKGAGRLDIDRLQLSPASARAPGKRATWVWRAERWQQDGAGLLDDLTGRGFGTAFVTVPLNPDGGAVADPEGLGRFVRAAGRRGVAVWAVEGDPAAVLPAERAGWIRRTQAFARYNAAAARPARLAGLQLDIEPYILPDYVRDPTAIHTLYAELIAALRASADIRLEVAMPFWFADVATASGRLLDGFDVDGIVVMDYRTEAASIQQSAEPFLAWGAARGRPVRIAVEYGALPDQEMLSFERARAGRLWLTQTPTGPELRLLAEPAANPAGGSYRLMARWPVPASRTTFHGAPDRLWRTVGDVERAFTAWPSFAGMAIHEPPLGD